MTEPTESQDVLSALSTVADARDLLNQELEQLNEDRKALDAQVAKVREKLAKNTELRTELFHVALMIHQGETVAASARMGRSAMYNSLTRGKS